MRCAAFSKRTLKEILRDPVNLIFGLAFPVVLILLLSAIQANIPVPLFEISRLVPGMAVFGLSFLTLFAAALISKDRETAFLQRLYATPLTPCDFIAGYTLPLIPLAVLQCIVCFIPAFFMDLPFTASVLYCIAGIIPVSVFFIALGLLCGSLLGVKQVGGICGALLTNLCAWLSGIWFDLDLIGEVMKDIAYALPFAHAVRYEQALLSGDHTFIVSDLLWITGYSIVTVLLAIYVFLRQMKRQ